jgi:hypothetical protein
MTYATPGDLAAWLQIPEIDTYTAQLYLDAAAGLMQAAGAPVVIDPVPADLRAVNVAVAASGFSNPKGLRSFQQTLGSAGQTETYAGNVSELGMALSSSQAAVCRRYRPAVTSIQLVGDHL